MSPVFYSKRQIKNWLKISIWKISKFIIRLFTFCLKQKVANAYPAEHQDICSWELKPKQCDADGIFARRSRKCSDKESSSGVIWLSRNLLVMSLIAAFMFGYKPDIQGSRESFLLGSKRPRFLVAWSSDSIKYKDKRNWFKLFKKVSVTFLQGQAR